MCSRFELKAHPRDLARCFNFDGVPDGFTQGEIRPTNHTLCVGPLGPFISRWGLKLDWTSTPLINVRAETLREKPIFQTLINSRCLVLATAYFEWRREGKARFKNRIAILDTPLFAFAGLTDGEHVAIVTCQPAPSIARIHDRMPVILSSDDEQAWIDNERAYDDIADLILPQSGLDLVADEEIPLPPRQGDLFE